MLCLLHKLLAPTYTPGTVRVKNIFPTLYNMKPFQTASENYTASGSCVCGNRNNGDCAIREPTLLLFQVYPNGNETL